MNYKRKNRKHDTVDKNFKSPSKVNGWRRMIHKWWLVDWSDRRGFNDEIC